MWIAWPPFLRRMLALRRARRTIAAGEHEEALAILRDRTLTRSRAARELRDQVLESCCRAAGLAIASGDAPAARRALALVAEADPTRGVAWGRRLALIERARDETVERPIVRLLEEMRGRRADSHSMKDGAAGGALSHNGANVGANGVALHADPLMSEPVVEPLALRFHVEVDDGGQFLAVASPRVVIGHLSSTVADLRFLADVEAEHVRIERRESFHEGPSWQLVRAQAKAVRVNGRAIEGSVTRLFDGDEVELARNLAFRFREPQASSHTVVLELLRGAECEGALKILLFAPGESGVVRIGSKRDRHIPLADIEHEVSLKLSGSDLWIHCDGGVRRSDGGPRGEADAESSATVVVACPPESPLHFAVRARARGRAPLGISLRRATDARERT
jgi:hypothetical protein